MYHNYYIVIGIHFITSLLAKGTLNPILSKQGASMNFLVYLIVFFL